MTFQHLTTYQTTVTQARAHRAIKAKTSYFLREHNITMMQWAIIGSLYESGAAGMRVSDLATQLDTSLAFVTTTLNVLEAKGIVERKNHTQDSRAKLVHLTAAFAPKVSMIEKELSVKFREWLVPAIGNEDLATYMRVLGKIAQSVA
jgi:MarR family transcriptional regulator, transcriptional regulator for hemolysin